MGVSGFQLIHRRFTIEQGLNPRIRAVSLNETPFGGITQSRITWQNPRFNFGIKGGIGIQTMRFSFLPSVGLRRRQRTTQRGPYFQSRLLNDICDASRSASTDLKLVLENLRYQVSLTLDFLLCRKMNQHRPETGQVTIQQFAILLVSFRLFLFPDRS